MSGYGLQDTPTDFLSFFHPTPRRHRRREKLDNHYGWNYTLKLPLSLIVTMHYAAVRNCRKCAFPGRPNVCPSRPGEARPGPVRLTLLPATATPIVVSKGLRSYRDHPCFPTMRRNESEVPPARRAFAPAHPLTAPYSRRAPGVFRFPNHLVVRSRARLGFLFLSVGVRVQKRPGECGFSVLLLCCSQKLFARKPVAKKRRRDR